MADTQLKIGGYTFTFTDSDVHSVKSDIISSKETIEISSSGPMSNRNYDYSGTKKTITIKGALTPAATTRIAGYTITTILSQKQWLESAINGVQSEIELEHDTEGQSVLSTVSATAPFLASFTSTKAMFSTITFEKRSGEPNHLPFTLILNVGGST